MKILYFSSAHIFYYQKRGILRSEQYSIIYDWEYCFIPNAFNLTCGTYLMYSARLDICRFRTPREIRCMNTWKL